jgi:hypothetical protein
MKNVNIPFYLPLLFAGVLVVRAGLGPAAAAVLAGSGGEVVGGVVAARVGVGAADDADPVLPSVSL